MKSSVRDRIIRRLPLQRRLEKAIRVPELVDHATVTGSAWGICIAKNEADIIDHTVRHFLNQGFDGLIVVDNGSTDGTLDMLRHLAATDSHLFVGTDLEPAFFQGRKMSYLAHLAWRAGAEWIVPFDADEQWFAVGATVPEFLRATDAEVVECAMFNVFPARGDDALDLSQARTLRLETRPTGWVKVAFRARPWVWVRNGNHEVRSHGTRTSGLRLRHFQYRSLEQISRKVGPGRDAVEQAFGRSSGFSTHWRDLDLLPVAALEAAWSEHIQGEKRIEGTGELSLATINLSEPWSTWDPAGELAKGRGAS